MVCQSYNVSNPHIEGYTVHGYAATVGMCHLHFGGASDTKRWRQQTSLKCLQKINCHHHTI